MFFCFVLFLTFSYRQAQATVLEAIPRLKSANIATKRPDDFYAQMAKTDEHMKKVVDLTFKIEFFKTNFSSLDSRISRQS